MLAALFSLRAAADRPVASVSDSTIASGVSVEGVDLSGMTPDQAKDALQAKADSLASTPVTLRYGSSLICATLADFGYTCTNLDIVDSLVPIGKSGNIVERYKEQKDLENNRVDYPLSFSVDFRRVKDFVSTCSAYNCDPVEGQLLIGEDGLPAEVRVTDHAGSFTDYESDLASLAPDYAEAVVRRRDSVADFKGFAAAYVDGFRRRLAATQAAYRAHRKAFDGLFVDRPYDTNGSGAYRWACALRRLDACDPACVADVLSAAIAG